MTHKYDVGTKVRHTEEDIVATIVRLTTLGEVVEGDCEDDEMDHPWYDLEWEEDGELQEGCECEDVLEPV